LATPEAAGWAVVAEGLLASAPIAANAAYGKATHSAAATTSVINVLACVFNIIISIIVSWTYKELPWDALLANPYFKVCNNCCFRQRTLTIGEKSPAVKQKMCGDNRETLREMQKRREETR
jgi:hypothetical protein